MQEQVFNTGEVALNYVETGSGAPVLLLHGLTAPGWRVWEPFFAPLSRQWRVTAVVLRGHATSGRGADYRVVDYGRDIAAMLREHFTEPVVLMGHSLGALTALAAAASVPEKARALVLLDPPLPVRDSPIEDMPSAFGWFSFVREAVQTPDDETRLAMCRAMMQGAPEADIQGLAAHVGTLDAGTVGAVLEHRFADEADFEAMLRAITCPTLLLYGDWEHEAHIRPEDVDFVAQHLPSSTRIKIPDGTHGFPWEQFELTMRHIETFLQTV